MTTTTLAPTKPVNKPTDIRTYIMSDVVKKQMAMVLPKHLTADKMARVVCTAILKTPKLAECRIESLLQSIMLLSQFGMVPDGRSAHLIPFFNSKANCTDCQAIIDWKGKVARAQQNGVENITTDIVCMNDKFDWSTTKDGLQFEHQVDWRKPDRGEMFAAYVVWRQAGQFQGVIMPKLEIDAIRKRSKSPDKGPWVTDYNEMAKKTVVHRASKLWPLDAAFREAIEVQEATTPTIDLPPLPVITEETETPVTAAPATPQIDESQSRVQTESGAQTAKRMVLEASFAFDLFCAEVTARNWSQDAGSWPSYDDVPATIWEMLAANPKTLATLIKKFGKK